MRCGREDDLVYEALGRANRHRTELVYEDLTELAYEDPTALVYGDQGRTDVLLATALPCDQY